MLKLVGVDILSAFLWLVGSIELIIFAWVGVGLSGPELVYLERGAPDTSSKVGAWH